MHLFWFCKFQYVFYSGSNEFFHFMFLLYRKPSARILPKERNGILILCLWVAIILIPCGVECSSLCGFQEITKVKNSGSMLRKRIFQESCEINFHSILCRIESQNFVFECLSEFDSCSVPFVGISQRERKSVSKPCAKESCEQQ